MSKKLKLNFSIPFEGNIWNMLIDPNGKQLILEIRDAEKHEVSFTAIDLPGKQVLWDGLAFEENWWVGLTALENNVLLLHQYEDSQNPENQQLFAVDTESREVLWAVTDFTYLHINKGQVVGFTREGEERHYSTIDLKSGAIAETGSLAAGILTKEGKEMADPARYPLHYPAEQEHFATFRQFITKHVGKAPVKGCDYLEYQGLILISYYLEEGNNLSNFLLVIDQEGEELLHETLDEQLPAVGVDTFFVIDDQLIFIKRKKELISYAF